MPTKPQGDLADLRYESIDEWPGDLAKRYPRARELWLPGLSTNEILATMKALPKAERVRLEEVPHEELKRLEKEADRIAGLTLGSYGTLDAHVAKLKPFKRLRRLGLRLIQMTEKGLAHLAAMGALEELEIVQAQLWGEGLAALPAPERLRKLNLSELYATVPESKVGAPAQAMRVVARFTNLEELWLAIKLQKGAFAELAPLTKLRELRTFGTGADDASMAAVLPGLTRLEKLTLWGNPVGDKGLAGLANAKNLTELSLERTRAGDATLALLAGHTQLEELNLADTRVTAAGIAHLAPLKRLRKLTLADKKIDASWAKPLGALTGLEELAIARGRLDKRFFEGLAGLPRLSYLNLVKAQVTDAEVPAIARLEHLQLVNLRDTKVKKKTAQALEDTLSARSPTGG